MIDSQMLAYEQQIPYTVLQMVRGDSAEFDFEVKNPKTGAVVDLTGATVTFAAKKALEDTTAVIDISTTSGDISLTAPTQGRGHVVIPSASTIPLPNEKQDLPFDLQVKTPGNRTWTVSRGRIEVLAQIAV